MMRKLFLWFISTLLTFQFLQAEEPLIFSSQVEEVLESDGKKILGINAYHGKNNNVFFLKVNRNRNGHRELFSIDKNEDILWSIPVFEQLSFGSNRVKNCTISNGRSPPD